MTRELAILGFVSFTATVGLQFYQLEEEKHELFGVCAAGKRFHAHTTPRASVLSRARGTESARPRHPRAPQ
eukprot:5611966-Prymnesium_polylepis.1